MLKSIKSRNVKLNMMYIVNLMLSSTYVVNIFSTDICYLCVGSCSFLFGHAACQISYLILCLD